MLNEIVVVIGENYCDWIGEVVVEDLRWYG